MHISLVYLILFDALPTNFAPVELFYSRCAYDLGYGNYASEEMPT